MMVSPLLIDVRSCTLAAVFETRHPEDRGRAPNTMEPQNCYHYVSRGERKGSGVEMEPQVKPQVKVMI